MSLEIGSSLTMVFKRLRSETLVILRETPPLLIRLGISTQ